MGTLDAMSTSDLQDLILEADSLLCVARGAVGRIELERLRGADYRHAEVLALLEDKSQIVAWIKKARGIKNG